MITKRGYNVKASKQMFAIILLIIAGLTALAYFGAGEEFKSVREMRYGIDIRGGVEAVFEPEGLDRKATDSELDSARNIIEKRLDVLNITDREVTIDKEGNYIIVRFPWKSEESDFNPEDAISELGKMAKLSFRDPEGNILLEGKDVVSSTAGQNKSGVETSYMVDLVFSEEGAKLFEEATGKLVGQEMGIYMDENEISSPTVRSQISGGQAIIDNLDSFEEAKYLAETIEAGALPFALKTTNFSTISPSLGNNALNIMVIAGIIAFALICIFMISMYKLPGVIACLTLLLQTVLQLLALSVPQYTLTLPGIAGIILTIGMAVDTNIIVAERITDEIGKGKTIKTAIVNGYKNAFSAVLDGNVTTAVIAGILMIFGSGAMLSFGYTLIVGMIVNLFVGVTISRLLLQSIVEFSGLHQEKFFKKFKERKIIQFVEKKKIYFAVSAGLILAGVIACFVNGVKLDTQFKGGVVLKYSTQDTYSTEELTDAVASAVNRPVTVQITEENLTNKSSIVVTMAGNEGISPEEQKAVEVAIDGIDASKSADLSETYVVEPYIGAKALQNAAIALVLSLLFIIAYIWIRFSELSAGFASILALVHDVVIVFFVFVIFRIPLNDAFVAVVLTIIGYSINDTIVMFDRVRENKQAYPSMKAYELFNLSTTETFTRSINTSITTGICTLVILVSAVLFNIESIRVFALPMFFGLISGAYSSICLANVAWAMWENRKAKKMLG